MQNQKSLQELATILGGQISGDAGSMVCGLCPLDEPQAKFIAFTKEVETAALEKQFAGSGLAALLIPLEVLTSHPGLRGNFIGVDDPYAAALKLIPLFFTPPLKPQGISERADVHPSAVIGKNVSIGAFASIGPEVTIGDDVTIHPHVVLYHGAKIGARSVIHAGAIVREFCEVGAENTVQNGAVIGADGFGYVPDPTVGLAPVPQVGTVKLGTRVDIGANTCIDRATLGSTSVGDGTKIDNLVQIGHNVKIGTHTIICGHAGIAGSTRIGNQVTIGGHAGIKDHVEIASGVRIGAKSGVTGNMKEKGDYIGFPAVKAGDWRRQMAALRRLPEMVKKAKGN